MKDNCSIKNYMWGFKALREPRLFQYTPKYWLYDFTSGFKLRPHLDQDLTKMNNSHITK